MAKFQGRFKCPSCAKNAKLLKGEDEEETGRSSLVYGSKDDLFNQKQENMICSSSANKLPECLFRSPSPKYSKNDSDTLIKKHSKCDM